MMKNNATDASERQTPAVKIDAVQKIYGTNPRSRFEALSDVSIEIAEGEMLVLLGPSGCGKTTLLRSIAGLEDLTRGKIEISGRVVSDPSRGIHVPADKRNLGFVFQNYALWPHMKVRANVAYPLRSRGVKKSQAEAEAASMLESLELGTLGDRYPSELSGGQQQRVALARSLVGATGLVLFDEPLSNIDAQLRQQVRAEIRRLHAAYGFTGVYVTHDQREAIELGNRIAVLSHGTIVQVDKPASIYRRPATPEIARFFGVENDVALSVRGSHVTIGDGVPLRGRVDLMDIPSSSASHTLFVRASALHVCDAVECAGGRCASEYCLLQNGRVADIAFAGDSVLVGVVFNGTHLTAVTDAFEDAPAIGDEVSCHFRPDQALVYPEPYSVPTAVDQ